MWRQRSTGERSWVWCSPIPWGEKRRGPDTKTGFWWSGSSESHPQPLAERWSWDWQVGGTDAPDKGECWQQAAWAQDGFGCDLELQHRSRPLPQVPNSTGYVAFSTPPPSWLCTGLSPFSLFLILGKASEIWWSAVFPALASSARVILEPLTPCSPSLAVIWSFPTSDSSAWKIQTSPAVWPHLSSFLEMTAKKLN